MDKGEAMERVCEYYGAVMADTIAIGDSMNDLRMLQAAGTSVVMGNSCEELKKDAVLYVRVWKMTVFIMSFK